MSPMAPWAEPSDRWVYATDLGNSIATAESEDAEREVVAWLRNHPRRPLSEWSDLCDPFEVVGWEDWSPVRSVRLATPAEKPRSDIPPPARRRNADTDPEWTSYVALRREKKEIARAVAALLTGRTRPFRSDRGRPRRPKLDDIPAILEELRSWPAPGEAC